MSNGKNGKNGSEKEIDRLLEIVRALARVDTKVTAVDDKLESEITDIKKELEACSSRLACIEAEGAKTIQTQIADIKKRIDKVCDDILDSEKRRVDLIKMVADLQKSFDRWKMYYSAIIGIGAPAITALIIYLIEHFIVHII